MHFEFTISIGQIATILTIIGVGWGLGRKLVLYGIEHEMLMEKYCNELGIEITKLPTRIRR